MAQIDFFLDYDEVFHGTIPQGKGSAVIPFPSSVRRINRLIEQLQQQGHTITVVPVTSYRQVSSEAQVQSLFEDAGLMKGLPFVFFMDGPRADVIPRRLAEGETDAYIIFDDDAGAYKPKQKNLIVVRNRSTHSCKEEHRGVTMGDITTARKLITEQLANVPARKKTKRGGPASDPDTTP